MTSRRNNKGETASADKHAQALREIQASIAENKKCFECHQRGPTYVDVTIGSFVCTKCSGMLRGITPPHRVKSISMSCFTSEDIERMRSRGNHYCAKVWLGNYDANILGPIDTKDDEATKEFIVQKYEKKRYYVDPSTIRHSLEQDAKHAEPSLPEMSFPSKFTSNLIGSTIQLHHNNPQSAAADKGHINSSKPSSSSSFSASPPALVASASSISRKKATNSDFASANLSGFAIKDGTADPFCGTTTKSSIAVCESFANFDNADFFFHSPFGEAMTTTDTNSTLSATPTQNIQSAAGTFFAQPSDIPATSTAPHARMPVPEDRYAALKDLEEIFKNNVITSDSPIKNFNASSSAMPSSNGQRNVASTGAALFGNVSPDPKQSAKAADNNSFAASPWTGSGWPMDSSSGSGSNSGGLFWEWPKPSSGSAFMNGSSNEATINPFTGASNLTQLNTSPWPITTSPNPGLNSTASKTTFSSPWGPPTPSDSLRSTVTPSNKSHQSDSNHDLFSKAPFIQNEAIRDLTKDIFGTSYTATVPGTGNPWSSSVSIQQPAPNPNNPFL